MKNKKSKKGDKGDIEKRLAVLEEGFKLAQLQGGLVTHPVTRFPLGTEMLYSISSIGPIVYPPIIYEVFASMLPTLKSGVKEVVIDAGPAGPSVFGFSTTTGFTTLPETNPFTNQPNNPAKITVKFLDGSTQEHVVQPGSQWKLTNTDFVLFN